MQALFSIHDLMPHTLADVESLLRLFDAQGLPLPALLVVPGCSWSAAQIDKLADWQRSGAELVAHGWLHNTQARGLYHRLHALLLSRNVAEHLALDREEVVRLMRRSHDWFNSVGLAAPVSYVPPAWALGAARGALPALPFRAVETLRGVYMRDGDEFVLHPMPLLGFEADNRLRAAFLRSWNALQLRRAERRAAPLRVAIHPRDAQLRLGERLSATLRRPWEPLQYRQLQSLSAPA